VNSGRPKVVVLGMMTKMPVAGVVWQTLHYLLGFERLGYDAYYVETHGRTPSMFMAHETDDGTGRATAFLAAIMRRFGLGGRWAFRALHEDGRCLGMSERELDRLFKTADMLLNLHGGTEPVAELGATDRLVYLETDPVQLQFELAGGLESTVDFLEPHCAFFTFAGNYGEDDCALPVSERYQFRRTRQPVLMDFWESPAEPARRMFTTIGNWRQLWRDVPVNGELLTWSKHLEFEKFIDMPRTSGKRFELALGSYSDSDRATLEERGWQVVRALDFSMDLNAYRRYIASSFGEFTAAKEQNVHLRTGWFSDRSATYLASGRPVITQDTGFGRLLPTGEGLFAFSSSEEAADAVREIDADPARHRRAARDIASEFFAHDVVLGDVLETLGMGVPPRLGPGIDDTPRGPFPFDMVLKPQSRRPLRLPEATVETVSQSPLPTSRGSADQPLASIVVVSHNTLVFTRMCLETVLANTPDTFEVIVVDNASSDGSVDYLRALAASDAKVRVVTNDRNAGFPAACNQGLALARGEFEVLLNSDTMVPPGWLRRLLAALGRDRSALVGPVTNRIGNEAEVPTAYETWGDYLREARARGAAHAGSTFEIPTLTMFCLAMHRETRDRLGALDDRFGVGTLEDDDYSLRARRAGHALLCAEDVLVHHFGEASFGALYEKGEHTPLLERNRRLFEEKWGEPWIPYDRREDPEYAQVVEGARGLMLGVVHDGSTVLVVSKGDERLIELNGVRARHFPPAEDGGWAGHHPADSGDAIAALERMRAAGAAYIAFPAPSFWWLDFYGGLARHLEERHTEVARDESCVVYALADDPPARARP
jgi:GT2 family glycosyltransferase